MRLKFPKTATSTENNLWLLEVKAKGPDAKQARQRLLEGNLRLIATIARRFHSTYVSHADMIAEGVIGLNKAIDKFELSQGTTFRTYAMHWIYAEISRAVLSARHTVHVPMGLVSSMGRVQREQEVTDADVALMCGVSVETARALRNLTEVSLDLAQNQDEESPFEIPSENESHESQHDIDWILAGADGRVSSEDIRMLLLYMDGCPLREIGNTIGCSGERVRQRINKAMACLRGATQ